VIRSNIIYREEIWQLNAIVSCN